MLKWSPKLYKFEIKNEIFLIKSVNSWMVELEDVMFNELTATMNTLPCNTKYHKEVKKLIELGFIIEDELDEIVDNKILNEPEIDNMNSLIQFTTANENITIAHTSDNGIMNSIKLTEEGRVAFFKSFGKLPCIVL
jgi:hypothetical protein